MPEGGGLRLSQARRRLRAALPRAGGWNRLSPELLFSSGRCRDP